MKKDIHFENTGDINRPVNDNYADWIDNSGEGSL